MRGAQLFAGEKSSSRARQVLPLVADAGGWSAGRDLPRVLHEHAEVVLRRLAHVAGVRADDAEDPAERRVGSDVDLRAGDGLCPVGSVNGGPVRWSIVLVKSMFSNCDAVAQRVAPTMCVDLTWYCKFTPLLPPRRSRCHRCGGRRHRAVGTRRVVDRRDLDDAVLGAGERRLDEPVVGHDARRSAPSGCGRRSRAR